MEVKIQYAKTHLSRLLERVAMEEEVVIAKGGKPVAKLVPITSARPKFKLGSAKGEFVVPDGFNDPLPKEIEDLFYGERKPFSIRKRSIQRLRPIPQN